MYQIACIKWGNKYSPEYVNRLFDGVRRHLDGDIAFTCMTDDPSGLHPDIRAIPIPVEPFDEAVTETLKTSARKGALRKVSLFKPGAVAQSGPILGFDLDVVITGDLSDLFTVSPGKICMRHDWLAKRRGRPDGHGSVFRFDPSRHGFLYTEFVKDPVNWMQKANVSEQKYTSMIAQEHGEFAYFPDDWIASFKRDAMRVPPLNYLMEPRLPQNARVMCFHGSPKMEEAVEGYKGGVLRHTRPASWLRDLWIGEEL